VTCEALVASKLIMGFHRKAGRREGFWKSKLPVFPSCCLILAFALAAGDARALVWPDVFDRVEKQLGSADPSARRAAAHELQTLGPSRGGPLVIKALSDPDEDVRLAAADSAIRLRVAAATDIVIAWLNVKEPRPKKKACEVAKALPNPRAVAPVARTLGDPDPEVRQAAAEALGFSANKEAVAPLLGRLDDQTPAVRIQIVAALARLGDERAVVPLVGKVQDSSPDVRQAVARALGELGDLRASQALLLQLRDNNNDVRREALQSLGRLHAPDAVDAIAPFALERTPQLRLAALAALGRIATKDSVKVLVSALGVADDAGGGLDRTPVRDALVSAGAAAIPQLHALLEGQPTPHVATSAAWVLGELRATQETATIVSAMRRGVLPVAAALRALAALGGADSVGVVLEFIGDPSTAIRAEALRAAQKLLDPARPDGRAVEPIAAALRDPRPTAAERAALAILLGRTGAPRAATVLAELTNARDPALRLAAIDALGLLGPAGADDALLDKLANVDAQIRLHAAVALSESGGAKARDVLLAKLEAGDEIDRSVVWTALAGILSRAATEQAVARVVRALDVAAGPERDAVLIALGRAPLASAMKKLAAVAKSLDPDDRRMVATMLAARAEPDAAALARAMLADADASVRAQAAWSLGTIGDAATIAALEPLVRGGDIDAAVNAAGAIGRVAARAKSPDAAAKALCPRIGDVRSYVRANAFAALSLAGARCGDGAPERKALAEDPSDAVRAAAALLLTRAPQPTQDDKRALDRCATDDHAGMVAHRCRTPRKIPTRTHAVEAYVIAEGATTPHAHTAYAIELADGLLRGGSADRRGAAVDPVAPEGELVLRRPSALAR